MPKILIVDDNAINQSITFGQLKTLGYEADRVCNGQEAVDAFGPVSQWSQGIPPYTLIFMDCKMPVMDGYEATKAIRLLEQQGDERQDKVIIVALTANVLEADRVRAFSAGMDDYLTKPVTVDVLKNTLDHWLKTVPASRSSKCLTSDSRHDMPSLAPTLSPSPNTSASTLIPIPLFTPQSSMLLSSPPSQPLLEPAPSAPSAQLTQPASDTIEQAMTHLDWEYLHGLSDADHDFEMTLLELFVEDCQDQLKQLKGAIARGDLTQIEQVAHYIKGAGANVGAQYIQHYAHRIECHVRETHQLACFNLELEQLEESLTIIQTLWSAQR
ncbi:MAG: response regulator [Symploca sp. SIO2B6]|nr:response regulator [Symploca sp. SIO2B6]